jgi:hypothetical protein
MFCLLLLHCCFFLSLFFVDLLVLMGTSDGRTQSARACECCCIWLSGPGFQDLDKWTLGFTLRTSGFRTSKALHPTVILSFSCHFSLHPLSLFSRVQFSRHFFLRPPSLFSACVRACVHPGRFRHKKC